MRFKCHHLSLFRVPTTLDLWGVGLHYLKETEDCILFLCLFFLKHEAALKNLTSGVIFIFVYNTIIVDKSLLFRT